MAASTNRSASRLFISTLAEEPPSLRLVRRLLTPPLVAFVILATFSGYRAIVQVYRVGLEIPDSALHAGSSISTNVASSGRVWVTLVLELVQGTRAETLGVREVPSSRTPSLDPRTRHGSIAITLTPDQLTGFHPGPAIVRATGLGARQWLRIPPPVVRERSVVIGAR